MLHTRVNAGVHMTPWSNSVSCAQPWRSGYSSRPAVLGSCSSLHCRASASLPRHRLIASAAAAKGQSDSEPPPSAAPAAPAGRRAQGQQQQDSSRARSGTPGQQTSLKTSTSSSSSRRGDTASRAGRRSTSSDGSSSSSSSSRGTSAAAGGRRASSQASTTSSSRSTNGEGAGTTGGRNRAAGGRRSGSSPPTRATQQPRQVVKEQQAGQQGSRREGQDASGKMSSQEVTKLIPQQTSLDQLLRLLERHSSPGDVYHANASLQWLVRNPQERPRSPQQLAALVQQLVKGVDVEQQTARNCANLALYCSKLGYVEDLGLYRALLQRFMVVKGEAKLQELSNFVYALGSQEQLCSLLEQDVLEELLQQLQQSGAGNAQDVSNALWAAAKVEPGHSRQLGQVVAQLLCRFMHVVGGAKPQEVSNTLYALAALPRAWPMGSALQLVERLVQLLPQAKPQEVSNVLWALGQYAERGWLAPLSEQPCAQLQAAATELTSTIAAKARLVKPQEVSNSLWGVALLQAQVDWGVMGQLLGRLTQQEATTQALANACWAVAKLQQLHGDPPGQQQPWQAPFHTAVTVFVPLLAQATPQEVANMVWACGVVRHYPQRLLQDLTAAAPQLQQATGQNVANLALGLAVLAPDPPPATLMASLLQRMQDLLAQQHRPPDITSQALANTAWAVAVLDQQQLTGQLAPLAQAAFSQQRWDSSQAEHLCQWHQVHLWLTETQVLGPAGLGAFPGVSQQQLEQCRAAWEEQLAADAKASQRQVDVSKVLRTMPGLEVMGIEQRDQHDGSRSIDIVARCKGQLLAVEVDGPQHFTWPGQRPTGDTLSRNRALERRGYRVVCVPVDPGWSQQQGQQQQQQYLQGLLDAAVEQPAASTTEGAHAAGGSTPSSSRPLGVDPQQGGNALRRLADAARRKQQQQQQQQHMGP